MLDDNAVNSINNAVSSSRTKEFAVSQTNAGQKSRTMFQRIAEADATAVRECLDVHGKLVWALAKQFTSSTDKAETAAREIFLDLWKHAARFDSSAHNETDFIILIARRWLILRRMDAPRTSATAFTAGQKYCF